MGVAAVPSEVLGQWLTHFVDRSPSDFLHFQGVGAQDLLGGVDQLFGGEPVPRMAVQSPNHSDPHQAHHMTALAGDPENIAAISGLGGSLKPDVRKVGGGQDVQDTPCMVAGVAFRFDTQRSAHLAAGSVAAHHIFGINDDFSTF